MHTNEKLKTKIAKDVCNIPCFKEDVVRKLKKVMPSGDEFEEARILFSALSDSTRLKILYVLKEEELCVCDVANILEISVSSASHHLRKLRDLKVLKYRNDGKMSYYSIRNNFISCLLSRTLEHTGA